MRKLSLLIGVVVLMISPAESKIRPTGDALNSLVSAERNFSTLSQTKSMREAFLTCLSDDAVVFRPKPINGKQYYRQRPDNPGILAWYPSVGDIASDGNFGYTTGPWQFSGKKGEEPSLYGDYVSVWNRQTGGKWEVVIDVGVSHGREVNADSSFNRYASMDGAFHDSSPVDTASVDKDLLAHDESFSDIAARDGISDAIRAFADDSVRMYRERSLPVLGLMAVDSAFTARGGIYNWIPSHAAVASSGDLGYTYGTLEIRMAAGDEEPGQISSYLHIWKRGADGKWRLVLDITNELPDEEAGQG